MDEHVCPRCKSSTLKMCIDGGAAFLRCVRCDGAYFSDEELLERFIRGKLGDDAGHTFSRWMLVSMERAETARMGKRICPICKRGLRLHKFGLEPHLLVVLDRCELHGFWLDKEEVEQVLRGILTGSRIDS